MSLSLDDLFGPSVPSLRLGRHLLKLDRARIMAIVNRTPDSFSDGGAFLALNQAVDHAAGLVKEGADLLDVGGESTRPGATPVSVDEELSRVVPLIEALAARFDVPISVDTSKPEVMRAAVSAGAAMINDVRALRAEGALDAAAELRVPVCLMHMAGEPGTMQSAPHYDDVVADVKRFLADRVLACRMAGLDPKQILVDPGFGFGKTLEHNLRLLACLRELNDLGAPLLVGLSRKRMIGELTGRELDQRAIGSAAAAMLAVQRGAVVVRVHDVGTTRDVLAVYEALTPYRKRSRARDSTRPLNDEE